MSYFKQFSADRKFKNQSIDPRFIRDRVINIDCTEINRHVKFLAT